MINYIDNLQYENIFNRLSYRGLYCKSCFYDILIKENYDYKKKFKENKEILEENNDYKIKIKSLEDRYKFIENQYKEQNELKNILLKNQYKANDDYKNKLFIYQKIIHKNNIYFIEESPLVDGLFKIYSKDGMMIYNGEWDTAQEAELYDGIQDLLEQKAKIAAIKYYRNTMLNVFKEEVKLRDAKDYVDKIESDLKDRGIIK